jgi:hypothetical protein
VNGPGELTVRIALTSDAVRRLDTMSKADFMASINRSMENIAGHALPWNDETIGKKSTAYWNEKFKEPLTVKARWAEAMNDLSNRETNGMDEMKIKRQYESSTGRNYYQDMSTFHSIEAISMAFDKARGKPLEGRTDFLKTLSRLSAPDLRATLMALHSDAGARVVGFEYVGNGMTIKPASEGPDVATARDIVKAAKVRANGADAAQAPQVE